MKYFSASQIHNGKQWMPEYSIIAIEENGTISGILAPNSIGSDQVIHYDGILCPGFVNAHCHLELSHMKGAIEEGHQLVPFLKSVMQGRNNFTPEQKEEALKAALRETRENGIVAVGDIANGTDTLKYRLEAGFHIHTFVEAIGFSEEKLAERFAWPTQVYTQFNEQNSSGYRLNQSIVPHAPYSVSKGMFEKINQFDTNSILSIHNEETAAENELYQSKTGGMFELYEALNINPKFFEPSGKSSLQTYLPLLDQNHPVILVHNTFMNAEDVSFIKASGREVYLCLCPNANWYIERRLPPVALFAASGIPVCLGTDSLASNHQLSIWSEVQLLQQHFPELNLETLLTWATYNGAKALHLEQQIGSLEAGKNPGLVFIDKNDKVHRLI